MKRILNGTTYNTETSTRVAFAGVEENFDFEADEILYMTRGGNFFIHFEDMGDKVASDIVASGKVAVDDYGEAIWGDLNLDEIHDWCQRYNVTIIDPNLFPGASDTSGTIRPFYGEDLEGTIYLRVPGSLKRRIEDAAKAESQSVNAWTMRCVENCLEERQKPT